MTSTGYDRLNSVHVLAASIEASRLRVLPGYIHHNSCTCVATLVSVPTLDVSTPTSLRRHYSTLFPNARDSSPICGAWLA